MTATLHSTQMLDDLMAERLADHQRVERILGFRPKSVEHNFLGTPWAFVIDFQNRAYWVNLATEHVIPSTRNAGR